MTDWLVQLKQGTTTLYLPLKGHNWAYSINKAGHFSFKDAMSRAKRQYIRFEKVINPQTPPPAEVMVIKLIEVNEKDCILSEQVITQG